MKHATTALFCLLAMSWAASAQARAVAQKPLCASNWADFQNKLRDDTHRLAFLNSGGPMKIGLCWWHSRLQRNANYLLDFRPSLPKLSRDEALAVVKKLSSTKQVSAVDGYRNLRDFSADYYREMTEMLGQWQMAESFFGNWVNGLEGESEVSAEELRQKMDELHARVQGKKEIVYQMLQYPGPTAHAWIVFGMKKTPAGYSIEAVDSNYYGLIRREYRDGDRSFFGQGISGTFVPYTQRTKDLDEVQRVIQRTCEAWGRSSSLTPR